YVKFENGDIFTGTGFAVRADRYMITNKHVVQGKDGAQKAAGIAVQFADSKQTFKADLIAVAPDVDLALLRVNVAGTGLPRGGHIWEPGPRRPRSRPPAPRWPRIPPCSSRGRAATSERPRSPPVPSARCCPTRSSSTATAPRAPAAVRSSTRTGRCSRCCSA